MLLYIDPGTGSMLFSMVIGLVTAAVFAGRALAVKLRFLFSGGGSKETERLQRKPIVIYSDSKRYNNIFLPICDEFEKRQQPLTYYTQSPDDPILKKNYKYVVCEYIGEGNKGIAKMNLLQADVCLSTTPGLNVLQWKRSREVGCYVHIPHAVSDFSTYRMFGLDYYDAVLINGENQKRFIRKVEHYWKTQSFWDGKEKELIMTGSVYMDEAMKHLKKLEKHVYDPDSPTILVAPSWGENTILKKFGARLLKPLVETGFRIIVRPHPQSYISETALLKELQQEFADAGNLEWNSDVDNLYVLNQADVMITDFSGVIYDYAFLFGRPVFYTEIEFDKSVYDADWFEEEPWDTKVLPEMGKKLVEGEFSDIKNILLNAIKDRELAKGIEEVRNDCWENRGNALEATVDYLLERQKKEALRINSEKSEEARALQPAKTIQKEPEFEGHQKTFRKKFAELLVLLSLPVILYFVEGPLSVYVANSHDFSFHYQDFFYVLLFIGIAVLFIGAVIGALLPERIHRFICSMILYLGVMSYVQDLFLNIKLSEVDGSNMHWEELKGYTIVNGIVWLIVLALFILFYAIGGKRLQKKYDKCMVGAAGFLSLIQLVSVITLLISAVGIWNQMKGQINCGLVGEEQYLMASDNNIVIFVVDSFGSSQFEYVLERNPDIIQEFHDFTYYENTDSCYTGTFPSMTFMLTGVPLVFDRMGSEYLEMAWKDEAVKTYFDQIHEAGYTFRLYSNGGRSVYGNMENLAGLIDNAQTVQYHIDHKAVLIRMAKISIYKYVPYIMKPRFEVPSYMFMSLCTYEGRQPVNCGNTLFYNALKEAGLSISEQEKNAVIIQHLDGMHPPNETASDGSYQPGSSLQETEEGVFLILGQYLEQLKKLGIYDNTTVIVTADHGRWDVMTEADDPQIVFFMKMPGQQQEEMNRSSAPISLADLRATILELMGSNNGEFGTSIFDWAEGELRERVVTHYENSEDYPKVPGEACNIYAEYKYTGDYKTLTDHIREDGADHIYLNPGQ